MKADVLAAKVGKDRATIYRYKNDEIKMPASLLRPLANALGMTPNELMDWGELPTDGTERQDKMREVLPLIPGGVSVEGGTLKSVLLKALAYGGDMESDLRTALQAIYQSLEKLVLYAEFLGFQRQK